MNPNFIEYDQDQQHLLPKDFSEWVEEDSLERFISDTIETLTENNETAIFINNLLLGFYYAHDICMMCERYR